MPNSFMSRIFHPAFLFLFFISIFFVLIHSCKRELSVEQQGRPSVGILDGITGRANLQGFIFDENYMPVVGATVKVGTYTAVTNSYGIFFFSNISTSLHNTVITVDKPGYFTQVKSMMVMEGTDNFIKAQLIPKVLVKTVEASIGGEITLSSGAKLVLPSSGIIDKKNGTPYNGKVNVYMAWMDPSQYNILYQMPGDLRGVTQDDNERMLITYGMLKVELESEANQPLQLAPNKKASLTFPVPSALQNEAPVSVPMWFFDEQKGRWLEEGSAAYKGGQYQTEVNHFTDWNVDVPYPEPLIKFCVVVVDENDKPYANSHVLIRRPNDSWGAHGYTNSNGYLCGLIPAKTPLKLEILGEPSCEQALLSTPIGPFNSTVDLDTILVRRNPEKTITVKGEAVDCNNKPVASGYIQATIRSQGFIGKVTNGKFEFTLTRCPSDKEITVFGYDEATKRLSDQQERKITGNSIDMGKIKICGDPENTLNIGLYAHYALDGNANDQSENLLHGVLMGNPAGANNRKNAANKAYRFLPPDNTVPRQGQYVAMPNTAAGNLLPLTISLWIKMDAAMNGNGNILSKYVPAMWNGIQVLAAGDTAAKKYYIIPWYLNSPSNRLIGDYGEPSFHVEVPPSKWVHFVFTVDYKEARIYLDNTLIATKPWTGTAKPSTNGLDWKIGGLYNGWFMGDIDDVRIYNRVLLDYEMKHLFEN